MSGLSTAIKKLAAVAIMAVPMLSATNSASAQAPEPMLQLKTSQAIIDGCLAFARENDMRIIIAIIDNAGNLNAFQRMDGSFFISLEISQMKARSAAAFRTASKTVGELRERNIGILAIPGIATWEGGLPITMADGSPLGGVGVSGASAAQDAACAQAGLDHAATLLGE